MGYLDKRAFAGQVARVGESPVITKAVVNKDTDDIGFGVFVCVKDNGAAKLTASNDNILGVTLKVGVKIANKPGEVLSVMSLPHGAEIWAQGKEDHGLAVGDTIQVEATAGADAGKVAKTATLELTAAKDKFYVTDVAGDLIKLMRKE